MCAPPVLVLLYECGQDFKGARVVLVCPVDGGLSLFKRVFLVSGSAQGKVFVVGNIRSLLAIFGQCIELNFEMHCCVTAMVWFDATMNMSTDHLVIFFLNTST